MQNLEDVVRSLIKPKAGARESAADKRNVILGLDEYSKAQRQRGVLLVAVLLVLLAMPLILMLMKIPTTYLPYLLGGSGLFAAGTVKLMLDAFKDVSRAHTLAMVCQGLDSADTKDVLAAWMKES